MSAGRSSSRLQAVAPLIAALLATTCTDEPTRPRAPLKAGAQAAAAAPQIAFTSERDGNAEIYVMNADGSAQTRLTNNTQSDEYPSWSPDGQRIVFTGDLQDRKSTRLNSSHS